MTKTNREINNETAMMANHFASAFNVETLRYRGWHVNCLGKSVDGSDLTAVKADIQRMVDRYTESYTRFFANYCTTNDRHSCVYHAVREIQQAEWARCFADRVEG